MSKIDFEYLTKDIKANQETEKSKRQKLVEKWEPTGLLINLEDKGNTKTKSNMAQLLENQAKELIAKSHILKESSEMSDIKGFQNVAFPIVRRVFGGLIANELVSVQPMSLPSGLLFYLDYTFGTGKAGGQALDWTAGGSVYGDQTGIGTDSLGTGGPYFLNSSYSNRELNADCVVLASGVASWANVNYDPDLSASIANNTLFYVDVGFTASVALASLDLSNVHNFSISGTSTNWNNVKGVYKRHNSVVNSSTGRVRLYYSGTTASTDLFSTVIGITGSYVKATGLTVDSTGVVLSPVFESDFAADIIPELDIKIQSVSVTAATRKLKAKWTPELAQDLNAYQNLDAEVELTSILSEHIALEIDREILAELLKDCSGATYYWSRKAGDYVDKTTGSSVAGGSFTGTVREWYETLIETIIDVANQIHRKTLRGKANFLVCGPDVATIFEATMLYKPVLSLDPKEAMFTMGIEKVGSLNNRFTVYVDPYFPRNQILIGYKGSSFLETGYVYAPYVPLIVTPTIFAPEDFTPRKGVMTRYAKKMVRTDFYGKVIIQNMNVL